MNLRLSNIITLTALQPPADPECIFKAPLLSVY